MDEYQLLEKFKARMSKIINAQLDEIVPEEKELYILDGLTDEQLLQVHAFINSFTVDD
jgi:hypothetical protein